jgi:hypothetical protein
VQDRYVGDIGDFGKYGLLIALCGHDLSLGVVWHLVPNEGATGRTSATWTQRQPTYAGSGTAIPHCTTPSGR